MADTSSYQESSSGTLGWYNDLVKNLLNQGKTQAGVGYTPYSGNQVAGFNPMQQRAFNLAGNNVGNWKQNLNQGSNFLNQAGAAGNAAMGGTQGALSAYNQAMLGANPLSGAGSGAMGLYGNLGGTDYQSAIDRATSQFSGLGGASRSLLGQNTNAAQNFGALANQGMDLGGQNLNMSSSGYQDLLNSANQFGGAGSGAMDAYRSAQQNAQYDPNQLNQYLSPYTSGVVNEIARLGNKNFNEQLAPSINNQYGSLGQYGSARQALALGKAAGETATGIAGQQANALNQAYNNAMNAYQGFAGMGANTGLSAGSGLGNLAGLGINAQQAGSAGLGNIGQSYLNAGVQGAQGQQALGSTGIQGLGNAATGMSNMGNWQGNLALGGAQGMGNLSNQYLGNAQNVGSGLSNLGQWGTSAGIQAGTGLGNLGATRSQLGIADYGTLFNAGQTQQQNAQNQLDVNYNNWQQKQQYPWQQLQNWQGLFGVNTPQQSSSWSTQLKKGGLVRYAEGGRFRKGEEPDPWKEINARVIAEQPDRDRLRKTLLLRELEQNPEDPNLAYELRQMEDVDSVMMGQVESDPIRGANDLVRQVMSQKVPENPRMELIKKVLGDRESFQQRLREALAPMEEPGELQKIGRAMLTSGAQGPANYGQLIGRAGDAYFSGEDERTAANKDREIARLSLEEKSLPSIGSGGIGSAMGGVEHYKFLKGKDGSLWGVSDVDPTKRHLVQPGSYIAEINKAAQTAADKDLDSVTFDDANQRVKARQKLINYYSELFSQQYAGPMSGAEEGNATPSTPVAPSGGPISPPNIGNVPPTPQAVVGKEARPAPGIIQTPQELKESEGVGTSLAKQYTTIQEQGQSAQNEIHNYDRMGQLMEGVSTGKLTPMGTEAASWLKSIGMDIDPKVPNKEAFKSLTAQMALELRNPSGGAGMPGAMSDKDREFLVSMVPNLNNTPEGIKLMIETRKKLAERSIQVAELARKYRQGNPRGNFNEGFYDFLADWSAKNPLFPQPEKRDDLIRLDPEVTRRLIERIKAERKSKEK